MIYHYNGFQFVFSAAICSRPTTQNKWTDVESTVKIVPDHGTVA